MIPGPPSAVAINEDQRLVLQTLEEFREQAAFAGTAELLGVLRIDSKKLVNILASLQQLRLVDHVRGGGRRSWAISREGRAALGLEDRGPTKRWMAQYLADLDD